LRRLVAETAIQPQHLVLPLFVREGAGEARAIPSMPGIMQHNRDTVRKTRSRLVSAV
jgi:porphobilinogen synthase